MATHLIRSSSSGRAHRTQKVDHFTMALDTSVLNSSAIENNFKIAQVLKIRGEIPHAINKFKDVCYSLEKVVKMNPSAQCELHFIPMSLGELSKIYQEKEDIEKALAFTKCQRAFLEFMANNKPNQEGECSTDGGEDELPEHTLPELFSEMTRAFEMEDAPPPKNPQEVVQLFLEAQKKQEQETARRNLEMLNKLTEERKRKLESSRWGQTVEWVNQNPIKLAVFCLVFLGVFLAIAIPMIRLEKIDPSEPIRQLRDEAARKAAKKRGVDPNQAHQHHHHSHGEPKMTQEDMKKFQEMVNELKKKTEEQAKQRAQRDDNL